MEASINIKEPSSKKTPTSLQSQIAVEILLDIKAIYESSNKMKTIKELLMTKYSNVETLTFLKTHNFALFDDDTLFFQEIKKEFKYILFSNQGAFCLDSFLFSITYYISIFYIDLVQKPNIYETNKRFFKECMVTIINNLYFLPKQEDQEAIAIKFYKYLIELINRFEDIDYKKSFEVR